jgi:hypothetical protein
MGKTYLIMINFLIFENINLVLFVLRVTQMIKNNELEIECHIQKSLYCGGEACLAPT